MQEIVRLIGPTCTASAAVKLFNTHRAEGRTPVISWDGERWSILEPGAGGTVVRAIDEKPADVIARIEKDLRLLRTLING